VSAAIAAMDPLQALVLHASALTVIAHGLPVLPVHRLCPDVVPSDSRLQDDFTATDVIDTVLTITREASQISQQVPYLRGLSGTILQIIKIKEVRVTRYTLNKRGLLT
jgi:hypothetical protein